MRGDRECPFRGVTKSVSQNLEEGAGKRGFKWRSVPLKQMPHVRSTSEDIKPHIIIITGPRRLSPSTGLEHPSSVEEGAEKRCSQCAVHAMDLNIIRSMVHAHSGEPVWPSCKALGW